MNTSASAATPTRRGSLQHTQLATAPAAQKTNVGAAFRTLILFLTFLTLTASAFHNPSVSGIASQLRMPLSAALFIATLLQHQGTGGLKARPRDAQRLIVLAWTFAGVAALIAPLSIAPAQAFTQVTALAIMVGTMHVHIARRWHLPGAMEADMRTVFWALSVAIASGAFLGGGDSTRFSGAFDNPNTLAIACLFNISLGLGLLSNRRSFLLVLTMMAMSAAAILRAETRTAVIALVVVGAVLALKQLGRKSRVPLTLIGLGWSVLTSVCVLLLFRGTLPLPAIAQRFEGVDYESLNTRNLAWDYALELWSARPATGYGFRLGELAFEQNRSLTAFTRDGTHNSYLQTLLEVGIIGMIPFTLLLICIIVIVLRCPATGIGVGLVAVLVSGLTTALTESFMLGVGQSMSWTFWLTAAAAGTVAVRAQGIKDKGQF